ncbi:bifunctional nicotinamidase/pyrazinamidase [Planktomarina sp.]|nr:bifunctional nicotinamidase/pyrazinamidase [Planktomarina sp.]
MRALIVVDVQNDFCPGGALAVAGGDEIVVQINNRMADFDAVILTQDWHPAGHSSFASSHKADVFSSIEMPYGPQVLWPDHCVQGSFGAAFHKYLAMDRADLILRKGYRPGIDSYSAFFENDHSTATGLEGYLKTRGVRDVTFVGLATDYCVAYSALDAARLGFAVSVDTALCRAIDMGGSLDQARRDMVAAKVSLL